MTSDNRLLTLLSAFRRPWRKPTAVRKYKISAIPVLFHINSYSRPRNVYKNREKYMMNTVQNQQLQLWKCYICLPYVLCCICHTSTAADLILAVTTLSQTFGHKCNLKNHFKSMIDKSSTYTYKIHQSFTFLSFSSKNKTANDKRQKLR